MSLHFYSLPRVLQILGEPNKQLPRLFLPPFLPPCHSHKSSSVQEQVSSRSSSLAHQKVKNNQERYCKNAAPGWTAIKLLCELALGSFVPFLLYPHPIRHLVLKLNCCIYIKNLFRQMSSLSSQLPHSLDGLQQYSKEFSATMVWCSNQNSLDLFYQFCPLLQLLCAFASSSLYL